MSRSFALIASIYALLSVALGAFGAHALKAILSASQLSTWHTAVEYQMMHALALLFISSQLKLSYSKHLKHAAISISIGVLLFSGSLYCLVLLEIKLLGMITPIGGLLFIVGWILLIYHFWRSNANQ